MAKYYGVELKALKEHNGENETYYSGNLYLNNKKIASWEQNSENEAEDTFIFGNKYDPEKFEQLIYTRCPEVKLEDKQLYPCTPEDFMYTLLNLTLTEKDFKKYLKDGYDTIVTAEGHKNGEFLDPVGGAFNKACFQDYVDYIETQYPSGSKVSFSIYKSPEDFIKGKPFVIEELLKDEPEKEYDNVSEND